MSKEAFNMNVPTMYTADNIIENMVSPNTIHCRNNALFAYFQRYLLLDVFSIYEWTLPETWDEDYFKTVLFCTGRVGIVNTQEFGVIPQYCTLGGYNVFYRPAWIMVTNPLLKSTIQADINKDCSVIKIMPDYEGIADLVSHYADKLALASESVEVDLNNIKIATIFAAENKAQAEAYKKMFDKVASGDPAVVLDKNLFNEDGSPRWIPFTQNVKNTYIITDLINDIRSIRNEFLTEIGIPNNNNSAKRERMIVDEVNANNTETKAKSSLWLESIKKGFKQTKAIFPEVGTLDVKFRFDDPETETTEGDEK